MASKILNMSLKTADCRKSYFKGASQTRLAMRSIWLAFSLMWIGSSAQNIPLRYNLTEELPAMTLVGNVVSDSTIGSLVSQGDIPNLRMHFLTEGHPNSVYFTINTTSGDLRTRNKINRESACPFRIECELTAEVAVRSQISNFFRIVSLTIDIQDTNDNPPDFEPNTFVVNVPEDESPGLSFELPLARDLDMAPGHGIAYYELVRDVPPFSLIATGNSQSYFMNQIKLEGNLDREKTPSYTLLLRAVDGGNVALSGTLTINIQVGDVNDNNPQFDEHIYRRNISEVISVGSVVVDLEASDLDIGPNADLSFHLLAVQPQPVVFTMFNISSRTGEIATVKKLDAYASQSYTLHVEVKDNGAPSRTDRADVIISILNTHNSPPEIVLNTFEDDGTARVSESASIGRTIAIVSVNDPDSTLSPNGIINCSLDGGPFELQASTSRQFRVILMTALDREDQALHSVTVTCRDTGTPPINRSASFIVEVVDENDNPPKFEHLSYAADVVEGPRIQQASEREVLVKVTATDKDVQQNAEITYMLAPGTVTDFSIYVDGSLVITNPQGVDREDPVKGAVREITVLAVDGGVVPLTSTTTVTITIRDTNDNPPRFDQPEYYFRVTEGVQEGAVVNKTTAKDADLEINAIHYFKLDENEELDLPFEVMLDGTIKVSDVIDRERRSYYNFHIISYDLGEPVQLSSSVLVHINIIDINDNSPVFKFPNKDNDTIFIPHTLSANTAFTKIQAEDADEGANADLLYSRDIGNDSRLFEIIPETGSVILVKQLTLEDIGPHYVAVIAQDRGSPQELATQTILRLMVYEGNITIPVERGDNGMRNVVVVVVLIATTIIVGLAILLTIVLIRRLDRQRHLYDSKLEDKTNSNMKHVNSPIHVSNTDSTTLSMTTDESKDSAKKEKRS